MRKTLLAALLTSVPASALGFQGGIDTELLEKRDDGVEITGEALSGQELINADLTNIGQPIGSVEEIFLGEDGKIAFIRYETSRFRDLDRGGTIAVSDLDLEARQNFDIDVDLSNIETEGADRRMRLTEEEQMGRILTNMLRSDITINDKVYDVRDVAFDSEGQAEYLLVGETSGGFLGSEAAFAVPYDEVEYRDGAFRAKVDPDLMRTMVVIFGS